MTSAEIIEQIKSMANEEAKKMYLKHGAKEPFYAVKIGDLKKIEKKVKKDYKLSLELYDSAELQMPCTWQDLLLMKQR